MYGCWHEPVEPDIVDFKEESIIAMPNMTSVVKVDIIQIAVFVNVRIVKIMGLVRRRFRRRFEADIIIRTDCIKLETVIIALDFKKFMQIILIDLIQFVNFQAKIYEFIL